MKIAKINENLCDRSPFCPVKRVCPKDAVSQKVRSVPEIDPNKCTGCGLCENYCPMGAVSIVDVEVVNEQSN